MLTMLLTMIDTIINLLIISLLIKDSIRKFKQEKYFYFGLEVGMMFLYLVITCYEVIIWRLSL